MRGIDEFHLEHPHAGSRMIRDYLKLEGYSVNRKRVQRLMKLMGLEAIYPRKNLSRATSEHKKYPYLLRGVEITKPDFVWSTDITYIPMRSGFFYLVAIIDWFSRCVLSWELSNCLSNDFCIKALLIATSRNGSPEIFNTDQGAQFTANNFVLELTSRNIRVSMDGKGRAIDNVYIERLWRSVKYENVYLKDYHDGNSLFLGLNEYFNFYNNKRPHSSLDGKTPMSVYSAKRVA